MSKPERIEKNPEITEKWRISIGLAVVVIGGGAWWLSAFYSDVQVMKSEVAEVKADVKALLRQRSIAGPVKIEGCDVVNRGPYSMKE